MVGRDVEGVIVGMAAEVMVVGTALEGENGEWRRRR